MKGRALRKINNRIFMVRLLGSAASVDDYPIQVRTVRRLDFARETIDFDACYGRL
jgi:hypothetical protein